MNDTHFKQIYFENSLFITIRLQFAAKFLQNAVSHFWCSFPAVGLLSANCSLISDFCGFHKDVTDTCIFSDFPV